MPFFFFFFSLWVYLLFFLLSILSFFFSNDWFKKANAFNVCFCFLKFSPSVKNESFFVWLHKVQYVIRISFFFSEVRIFTIPQYPIRLTFTVRAPCSTNFVAFTEMVWAHKLVIQERPLNSLQKLIFLRQFLFDNLWLQLWALRQWLVYIWVIALITNVILRWVFALSFILFNHFVYDWIRALSKLDRLSIFDWALAACPTSIPYCRWSFKQLNFLCGNLLFFLQHFFLLLLGFKHFVNKI